MNPAGNVRPVEKAVPGWSKLFSDIWNKRGRPEDIGILEELCGNIAGRTVCAFGEAEVAPVLSTLRHWRDEYDALIREAQEAMPRGKEIPVLSTH